MLAYYHFPCLSHFRYTGDHKMCCYIKNLRDCVTIEKQPLMFQCGSLMQNSLLRVFMWVIGLSSVFGNIFVLFWRIRSKNENNIQTVQAVFVGNLAFSDLLMGFYMIFLASVDRYYGDEFFIVSDDWRVSIPCRIASTLAILSSETSLLLILFITFDRYLVLVFPFSLEKHFKKLSATIAVIGIWCITLPLSLSASFLADVDSDFYELSDVCIGLPLVTRPASYKVKTHNISHDTITAPLFTVNVPSGSDSSWYFSLVVYLGLNFCLASIIVVCYTIIFVSVRNSRRAVRKTRQVTDDIIMALRMIWVAMVNSLCWLPVTIVSILSQADLISVPLELYVWTVVFILPINAALNPYVYTISLMF